MEKLARDVRKRSWEEMNQCPEGSSITRVHIDAYGYIQFCQGISIGNTWERSLKTILEELVPERHPIIGPLIRGGPKQLARDVGVMPGKEYADECHM